MKVKINLDTMSSIKKFVNTIVKIKEPITLEDSEGHVVSAHSILGALYTMEWVDVYCCCSKDITGTILPWII